jgi:LytS/YehU family sensor histidine kinase
MRHMNTKNLTFAIMMGALGTALFAISYYVAPIAPSLAFDFSLIGVLVAGYYGGPKLGFLTGLIAGILPGIMFGPLGSGGVFGLIGLPIGKALTGMTAGLISSGIKFGQKNRSPILAIPSTFIAYIPESLFTGGYFVFLLGVTVGTAVFSTIIVKALIEIAIMSVVLVVLLRNNGFSCYVRSHFLSQNKPTMTANTK